MQFGALKLELFQYCYDVYLEWVLVKQTFNITEWTSVFSRCTLWSTRHFAFAGCVCLLKNSSVQYFMRLSIEFIQLRV